MARAIDIQRKRRTTYSEPIKQPASARPSRRTGLGGLLFTAIILLILIKIFTNTNNPQKTEPIVTLLPTETPSPTQPLPTITPTQTLGPITPVTPTPTPTPSPTIDKSALSIRILNGSGTPGLANQLKRELETDGFRIASTAVANNRYQKTMVYHKADNRSAAELVGSFLENHVVVYEENPTIIGVYDLLIVVGVQ